MRIAFLFACAALACLGQAVIAGSGGGWVECVLDLYLALCLGHLVVAYVGVGPRVFNKGADGHLGWWTWVWGAPYLLVNDLTLNLYRWLSSEPPSHRILPWLLLGRRPTIAELKELQRQGAVAVLDLTSEFAGVGSGWAGLAYATIPLLDTRDPTTAQIQAAVDFIIAHRDHQVLVHCALGHGRSATMVAAVLLRLGVAQDPDQAEELLREVRPGVRIHPGQRRALRAWWSASVPS